MAGIVFARKVMVGQLVLVLASLMADSQFNRPLQTREGATAPCVAQFWSRTLKRVFSALQ